ncbi:thiamine phosphate synthase [Winogradskyella sp. UBA3174]|uniref:thiamine phosphate synthase n=1 Tax=Winogradskyella sp. UBA3174 TaxID=1947785 RepID=UPI0026010B8E|nr:thiamine phosphate synthase [Winogradskyella sp. UBA3174]|tara:strand:- start:3132 stop:3776 length:645 start_codon:yes stop_codon:yes gene_type:complete
MIIPKLHYISQGSSPKEHLENIQKACTSGVELVQLRLKNVSEKKVLKIAEEAREITSYFQTRLIINDHYKIAKAIKADGAHLGPTDVCLSLVRKHLYTWQMIGGTANTFQDCEKLLDKEIDYISLGPFRETTTKDNTPLVLGLKGYVAITDVLKTPIPIIGVGGITTEDVTSILETGISGIAVSAAITKDFNSIKIFNELLNASATAEQRHSFK